MARKKLFDRMFTFMISHEMYDQVKKLADRDGQEMSFIIRNAIKKLIRKELGE